MIGLGIEIGGMDLVADFPHSFGTLDSYKLQSHSQPGSLNPATNSVHSKVITDMNAKPDMTCYPHTGGAQLNTTLHWAACCSVHVRFSIRVSYNIIMNTHAALISCGPFLDGLCAPILRTFLWSCFGRTSHASLRSTSSMDSNSA